MSEGTESLLELLQQGKVREFNSRRGRRARLEFFAADLSGLDLSGVDLSGVQLEKADFSETNLSDAVLMRTNLSGADLSSTTLKGAELAQARLRDAWIEDSDFSDANLMGADFSDAEIHRSSFQGASLGGARFKRATLVGTNLDAVDGHEMKLSGASLDQVSFKGAELAELSMKGSTVKGGSFFGADLRKAQLRETTFTEVVLDEAILSSGDLSACSFVGCSLSATDLSRADLSEATFESTELDEAVLLEAEVPPELLSLAMPILPDFGPPHLADAAFATDGRSIAATWTEEDEDDRQWVRVGVGRFGETGFREAAALPVPGELVVATAIASTPEGYVIMVLVERPGGVATQLYPLSADASPALGAPRRIELPYRPLVRPILRWENGALLIYGLASGNPSALTVMKVGPTKELEICHASAAGTARGFASDHTPVVLSKGGTLSVTTPRGPSGLSSAPGDFPGRSCGVSVAPDGELALSWVPGTGKGVKVTTARPGRVEEEDLLDRKIPTGFLDSIYGGGAHWTGFLQPDLAGTGLAPHVVSVPELTRHALEDDQGRGARVIRMASSGPEAKADTAVAIVVWDDGAATAWALGARPQQRWTV